MDCIYLDFKKVPYRRLLQKLEHIGRLKGTIKNWMEDYLKGREIKIIVKDEKSEWREVNNRVTQGSVLAPIMLLVYVNDMAMNKQLHKSVCR